MPRQSASGFTIPEQHLPKFDPVHDNPLLPHFPSVLTGTVGVGRADDVEDVRDEDDEVDELGVGVVDEEELVIVEDLIVEKEEVVVDNVLDTGGCDEIGGEPLHIPNADLQPVPQ